MPDKWGRFSMSDGLNIARSAMAINEMNERSEDRKLRREDRQAEKDAYAVANLLGKNPEADLSGFGDEAKYLGAKRHWDAQLQSKNVELTEKRMSNEGMREKLLEFAQIDQAAGQLYKQYRMARQAGNDDLAKKIARRFNNVIAYNGVHVDEPEDGAAASGKLSITRWDGSREQIDDFPMEEYDRLITSYMDMPDKELKKLQINGDTLRINHNFQLAQKAEPWINDQGQVLYLVPEGMRDKRNSSSMPAFFIRQFGDKEQIPVDSDLVRGFRPMPESLRKLYDSGVEMTPENREIAAGVRSKKTATGKKSDGYKNDLDAIKALAKPFMDESDGDVLNASNTMTSSGKNAIERASALVQKHRRGEQMTDVERQMTPAAYRLMKVYNKISEKIAGSYGSGDNWRNYR